ncbi:MAG: phosphatidylserine decarboxylase [Sulfuricurvum sp. PC08-66]|nr:MAG: phosphatidylserine decarboxylase [Sulfuricurvum sp. PC08-66]
MPNHTTNTLSRLFGSFASTAFWSPVQRLINTTYVKSLGLDMGEFGAPASYSTLNALFTRALKAPRAFDSDPKTIIAPCDSYITHVGRVEQGTALQIKGMRYEVRDFLTSHITDQGAQAVEHALYMNFYLSPRDYHRYHAPMDMQIVRVVYVPGKLYPVNKPSLLRRENLFIENERVVIEAIAQGKRLFLVLVGALNVGNMVVNFEPAIETNTQTGVQKVFDYSNTFLKKGEEFGHFKMGSTIILIAQEGLLTPNVTSERKIAFGERIATCL